MVDDNQPQGTLKNYLLEKIHKTNDISTVMCKKIEIFKRANATPEKYLT